MKFIAIIITASAIAGAIVLIGYTIWSLFQPKVILTAKEKMARQQKYELKQIQRRWYNTVAAILLVGISMYLGKHSFSWWHVILPVAFSIVATQDWLLTFAHRRSEPTPSQEH